MPYKTQTNNVHTGWKKTPPQTQPPKQEEQKGQTIEMIAKFLFITESINKNTGKPMEGETNGKKWKCWDVVFNKQGAQQNKIFKVFNDLSGKSLRLNDLVAGQDYKLLYEQGIAQVKANRLFWVGKPLGDAKPPVLAQTPPPTTYAPPTQNTAIKQPQNQPQVPPELKQLWDNSVFDTFDEWMKIAFDSGLFNSEEQAKLVHDILSGK